MSIGNQPYLNILQNLNLYSPSNMYNLDNDKLSNTISSIGSIVTNNSFDFRNTLLARVILPNTPLQQIATQELAKAFAVRFAQNLRTNKLPSISVNGIFNITVNKPLSYWKIDGKENKGLSELLKVITGYQRDENPVPFISDTFSSGASDVFLKKNRGQGQKDAYQENINRNRYNDEDIESYTYGRNDLDEASIKKGEVSESLLFKTNKLLNKNNLFNGEPSDVSGIGDKLSPSAMIFKHLGDDGKIKLIGKGDGTYKDNDGKKFLRTFSQSNKYDSTYDLMKYKHGTAGPNSVLQTVYPNIAPKRDEAVKNLMFSIENLAYKNDNINLPKNEKGPTGGRIMWFAPYDVNINESTSVGWDKVDFIGRSEPIHTYNGSERSANISFTLIADYPAELNSGWNKSTVKNNDFDKYFRQDNGKVVLSKIEEEEIEVNEVKELPKEKPKPVLPPMNPFDSSKPLKYYFDNDDYTLKSKLTQDNNLGTGQKSIDLFNLEIDNFINFLNSEEGSAFTIMIDSSSSALYTKQYNKVLSFFRGKSLYNRIFSNLKNVDGYKLVDYNKSLKEQISPNKSQSSNEKVVITYHGESIVENVNSTAKTLKADVIDRYAAIYLKYNPKLDERLKPEVEVMSTQIVKPVPKVIKETKQADGLHYFERYKGDVKLTNLNPNDTESRLISTYADNIKYFMPVFHSQTPIDLNKRVTFLQQCTKQGNSVGNGNSIFGTPPVCVLRLGDFFNTRIIITNMTLDYEPLIWDTNPEGIGMQPMLCRVNISCMIIGGSSLRGPLTKLQNALDYNFYANTEHYNKNAEEAGKKEYPNSGKN